MNSKLSSPSFLSKPTGIQLLVLLSFLLLTMGGGFAALQGGTPEQVLTIVIPFAVSALVSSLLGYWVIPVLRRLKAGQVIQEDGPQSHLKKAGTPTMGGIFFVPTAVLLGVALTGLNSGVIAVALVTLGYMGIGWIDDWQILRQQSNKGLTPRQKLILQIAIAVIFCFWLFFSQSSDLTQVKLPGLVIPFGLFFWLLAGFTLVAESNATNLTDGVDGLAAGTSAIAFLGLALLVVSDFPQLAMFSASMSGGCLGFLIHNRNPAQVFMGDTGSLALGGSLAAIALLSGNLWGLFLLSGIFLAESLSVIAQVGYYKSTKGPDGKGKRLFKMAPLHHHFELSGWAETQIVGIFYLVNSLLAVLAILSS